MIIDAHLHIFGHAMPGLTPPEYGDGRFPAERALALIEREGVSQAVIVQNPAIGTINEEVAGALEQRAWMVHRQVGCSGYRIDLAVVDR